MALRNSTVGYSVLAVACFASVLFGIAATIVLALIPIYLPSKAEAANSLYAIQQQLPYSLQVPPTLPLGPLSATEMAKILAVLRAAYSDSTRQSSIIAIKNGAIVYADQSTSGRKRRQGREKVCSMTVVVGGKTSVAMKTLEKRLETFTKELVVAIVQAVVTAIENRDSTTTTTNPITTFSTIPANIFSSTTSTPAGRRRRDENKNSSTSRPLVTYSD